MLFHFGHVYLHQMISKTENRISEMQRQITSLRSAVISIIGEDKEGKYRRGFVKDTLMASREKPVFSFQNKDGLLKQIHNVIR